MTEESSSLESIRAFFLPCPLLAPGQTLGMDYLRGTPPGYAIRGTHHESTVLRRYLDGGSLRATAFLFCAYMGFGDAAEALRARRFYDALEDWITAQNHRKMLPFLSGGRRALSLQVSAEAFIAQESDNSAEWALPCKMLYHKPSPIIS